MLDNSVNNYIEFENQINSEGTYSKELYTIQSIMEQVSRRFSLPEKKFKKIHDSKISVPLYEIKTRNLRVYLFHEENVGHIVVSGGKKTTQSKDIKQFKNIVKVYLVSKN